MSDRIDGLYVPEMVPESDRAYLEHQDRYGNRVGWGERPAVLLVDMTLAFLEERRTGEHCVEATADVLETARSAGVPVFYAVPEGSGSYPDGYPVTIKASPASDRGPDAETTDEKREWIGKLDEIPEALEPRENEPVIGKPRASAFFDTHLSNLLHHYDVDTLVVCGLNTTGCVRATVVDSHSSNFRTVVPVECVADTLVSAHEMALFDMDLRYADVTPVDAVLSELRDAE